MRSSRLARVMAALVALLVVAGATALLLSGLDGGTSAAPEAELSACLGSAAERRDACFERVFRRQAARGNVVQTLAALERLAQGERLDDCHLLSHSLAHAAVAALGVDRALLLAGDDCRHGYVHGVAELADPTKEAREAPAGAVAGERCSRFARRELAASCSHGYGHALLRAEPGALEAAAAACARAERFGIEVLPCEAGVMMQHSLDHVGDGEAGLRDGAAPGCAELAETRLRTRCFRNVGVVAAFALEHDVARAERLCRQVPDGADRADCLAGARKEIDEAGERPG